MERTLNPNLEELFLQSPDLDLSLVSAERQADAVKRRAEQLKHWQSSELFLTPIRPRDSDSRVRFDSFECFIDAVKKNDLDYVWAFLRSGKDVNGPIVDGLTAIHQAVLCSSLEMIKLLVESGADVNVKDVYGWTPLHASVYTKDTDIVRYLIDKEADPLCVNIDLEFPVDICEQLWSEEDVSSSGKFRLREIKKILVSAIGETDVDSVRDSEKRQMLADAKHMLDNPEVPVPVCSENSTPLHVAASKGYLEVLSLLVEVPCLDINASDSDGWTPLHAALFFEQDKAAELLVMAGASMHLTTKMNETLEDVCSDEMLDVFNNLKNQRPNYGSGMGSIGKRRLSFPIRALRAGSIDQKDRDNERLILEQRGTEDLSLEDSPEMPRRAMSDINPPPGHTGASQTARPSNINTGHSLDSGASSTESHLPRPADPSGKYLHYGVKSQEGQKKSPYPVQNSKGDKNSSATGHREASITKYAQKPASSNGAANITTRRVRSDVDARNNRSGVPDAIPENSIRSVAPPTPRFPTGPTGKLQQKSTPVPNPQPELNTSTSSCDTPTYARSTSEIARKTVSRKSLDGRRKTQPVDQEILMKAMEEYSNSGDTTEEPKDGAGGKGSEEETAAPVATADNSSTQETPNNRTESRFKISRIPSKESTGPDTSHFTPSERRVLRETAREYSGSHGTGGTRLFSDLGRTPSLNREQRPWPVTNRVSAIIGNFEKSGPAAGSSSGSAVSLDSQKEETGEKVEQSKETSSVVTEDFSSPNLRRDRTSYSSTARKVTKPPRRSTGISQEDVADSLTKDSLEQTEETSVSNHQTPTISHHSNATSHLTSTPYNYHSSHNSAPSYLSHQQIKNQDSYAKPVSDLSRTENDSKPNSTASHSRLNSRDDRTNNDSIFFKKMYEQEQNANKRLVEDLNLLKVQRELWEQDQAAYKKLQEDLTQIKIDRELDLSEKRKLDKYLSQLQRRLSDTTRAYEQEKKEKTKMEVRLKHLEFSEQRIIQIEAEKQRTEDENKQLIEVIKSLSGTSF